MKKDSEIPSEKIHQQIFTIRTSRQFINRINKHLKLLKRLEIKYSQQKWIEESINEKLENIRSLDLTEDLADKFLSFKLDKGLSLKIQSILKDFRKIGIRLNKKEFFMQAISEKLEREEKEVNQKAQELLQHMIFSKVNKT